jgi:hypothetical protein
MVEQELDIEYDTLILNANVGVDIDLVKDAMKRDPIPVVHF